MLTLSRSMVVLSTAILGLVGCEAVLGLGSESDLPGDAGTGDATVAASGSGGGSSSSGGNRDATTSSSSSGGDVAVSSSGADATVEDAPAEANDALVEGTSGSSGSSSSDAGNDTASGSSGGEEGSGSGDAGLDACTNACTLNAKQCATGGSVVQTCTVQSSGCTAWVTSATCGSHQACTGTGRASACTCASSICSAAGAVCQNGTTVATCAVDTDGCSYVASTSTCQSPQSCSGTAPNAACSLTCSNSCSQGQKSCVSGNLATCALGSNGCWAYATPVACPARQSCTGSAGSASCTCNTNSTCPSAASTCADSSTVAVCTQDSNGCFYQSTTSGCSGSTSLCLNGACVACSPGSTQCSSGTQPQTCSTSGSWQNATACSGTAPACLNGSCVACSPGATQCASSTQPQTCSSSGTWQNATACSGMTSLCSNGACICASTQLYVDVVHGSDANAGSSASPLRTITHATSLASANSCIGTINVASGTYNVANGETFPIVVPPNVALVGDEPNKGNAASPVFINGSGPSVAGPSGGWWTAVYPSAGSTVAGFKITAPVPPADAGTYPFVFAVELQSTASNATVRNCTLLGGSVGGTGAEKGIYLYAPQNVSLTGNAVTHFGTGIANAAGATSAKLEGNVITLNGYGVEADAPVDLGGGALSSVGGNTLSCNYFNDLYLGGATSAKNNAWDHVPPTTSTDAGAQNIDIHSASASALADTTGATLASSPCP